ncbi:uncharacterized protein LOC121581580 [Coregonus clupeaformis]|uniref:uncharacterized protein LOC121581580 n=1 Tax=Coregonus clupeaformis TaxID=59861 RepID=UPI001E1C48AF|nr:uncharacterized protein LOC121581580 [Coregonus clupeaformis]
MSTEEKIRKEWQMITNQMSSKCFPDEDIDKTLLQFSGPRSLEKLNQHYKKREMELNENAAVWIKDLAENLVGLLPIPDAAGLGSLVISIVIDRSVAAIKPPEDSTDDLLHRIFAKEKASAVRDQMDEYLKRHLMNIRNKAELKSDIKHVERNLSFALTQLKNSMLLDGQMSSRALRIWVNGAAFHVQMLIHLARLDGARDSGPVRSVITTYQSNLEKLLSGYKEYKKKTFQVYAARNKNILMYLTMRQKVVLH